MDRWCTTLNVDRRCSSGDAFGVGSSASTYCDAECWRLKEAALFIAGDVETRRIGEYSGFDVSLGVRLKEPSRTRLPFRLSWKLFVSHVGCTESAFLPRGHTRQVLSAADVHTVQPVGSIVAPRMYAVWPRKDATNDPSMRHSFAVASWEAVSNRQYFGWMATALMALVCLEMVEWGEVQSFHLHTFAVASCEPERKNSSCGPPALTQETRLPCAPCTSSSVCS